MKRSAKQAPVPSARDFMRRKVFSFAPDVGIREAIAKLLAKGYSGAPVVDATGAMVGMLSEWDCARVLSEAAYEGWPAGSVKDHMTTKVDVIAPSTDLFTIVGMFSPGTHRRFPVAEDGRLVGLITRRDLLGALHQHIQAKQPLESTYELMQKRREE
jgi:CBS domain-containing protein